jgi:hypothetical protein
MHTRDRNSACGCYFEEFSTRKMHGHVEIRRIAELHFRSRPIMADIRERPIDKRHVLAGSESPTASREVIEKRHVLASRQPPTASREVIEIMAIFGFGRCTAR